MSYTIGSLFAGIGGFDLGFERAGFKTAWQVEIDPYCTKVLANNFPEAERFGDIRECGSHNLRPVDVICGGFPCQDISNAGKRAGIEGERSGLWGEYARIIRILRPRFALIENVAALLNFGMERVLCDLAAIGYDAEWQVISASYVGAPHIRRRLWILAYPGREGIYERGWDSGIGKEMRLVRGDGSHGLPRQPQIQEQILAHAHISGLGRREREELCERTGERTTREGSSSVSDAHILSAIGIAIARRECGEWCPEPNVGRVAHGVPKRVDRLRGLGNAVVPQIPEMIARRIKQALEAA